MKAIKVTARLKQDNQKIFGEIGSIYYGKVPNTFVKGNETVLAYDEAIETNINNHYTIY